MEVFFFFTAFQPFPRHHIPSFVSETREGDISNHPSKYVRDYGVIHSCSKEGDITQLHCRAHFSPHGNLEVSEEIWKILTKEIPA